MARPGTKADLLEAADARFDTLFGMIDALSEEQQQASFDFGDFQGKEAHWTRDKNLRDVLIHLYEWHQLLINWVEANQAGTEQSFLPAPYNWKNYGEMNVGFWEKHQNTDLADAKALLKKSHADARAVIEGFTNEELFSKGAIPWTGNSALGSYCVSATSSHYDWAIKKLKKAKLKKA